MKLIIEVEGGVVTKITSEEPVKYVVVDWDNIDAGDDVPDIDDFRDDSVLTEDIDAVLTTMRVDNILKYDGNEGEQS